MLKKVLKIESNRYRTRLHDKSRSQRQLLAFFSPVEIFSQCNPSSMLTFELPYVAVIGIYRYSEDCVID